MVFPKLAGHGLEQHEIIFPQHAEKPERLPRISILIAEGLRPNILIVSLNGRTVGTENLPNAPATHDLGIRKMRQDLRNRPFPGRGSAPDLFFAEAPRQLIQLLSRALLDLERIFPINMAQDSLGVLLCSFLHGSIRPRWNLVANPSSSLAQGSPQPISVQRTKNYTCARDRSLEVILG